MDRETTLKISYLLKLNVSPSDSTDVVYSMIEGYFNKSPRNECLRRISEKLEIDCNYSVLSEDDIETLIFLKIDGLQRDKRAATIFRCQIASVLEKVRNST